jgi:hypothetical protein
MKRGLKGKDEVFLRAQLDASQQRAQALESAGDLYGAYEELRCTAADLNGLLPIPSVQSQVQKLKDDKRVKAGTKHLQQWLDLQARLVATVGEPLQSAREGSGERQDALVRTRTAFRELYERVLAARKQGRQNEPDVLPVRRAAFEALASLNETGRQAIRNNDPNLAIGLFSITAEIVHSPAAFYERARALTMLGKKTDALTDIKQALASGVTVETICTTPEFKTFLTDDEFLDLMGEDRKRCKAL